MLMSESDKMQIKNRGGFLIRKGYRVSTGEYSVTFDNGQMKIDVFYERYDNHQDILLKFPNRKSYYLHFFVYIVEKIELKGTTPLQKLLAYMDYLEKNYDNLMNEQYCERCMEYVRQNMETLVEVPIYKNESAGDKKMSNQGKQVNQIETPQDKKKANMWSWISLGCFVGKGIIELLLVFGSGFAYAFIDAADDYDFADVITAFSEAIYAIAACVSGVMFIASIVIMIYVRVKYPKNVFGKVLMWVYIVLISLYIITMAVVVIAIGIACAACIDECESIAMLAIERMMIC